MGDTKLNQVSEVVTILQIMSLKRDYRAKAIGTLWKMISFSREIESKVSGFRFIRCLPLLPCLKGYLVIILIIHHKLCTPTFMPYGHKI